MKQGLSHLEEEDEEGKGYHWASITPFNLVMTYIDGMDDLAKLWKALADRCNRKSISSAFNASNDRWKGGGRRSLASSTIASYSTAFLRITRSM